MTPPDGNFVLQLLLAAVLIGNAVAIWIGIINGKKIQRREVNFAFEPASKEEFTAHVEDTRHNFVAVRNEMKQDRIDSQGQARQRTSELYAKIDGSYRELSGKMDQIRMEAKSDTQGVHHRINDVLSAVSELKGKTS